MFKLCGILFVALLTFISPLSIAGSLPNTVVKVKPSIVGIGLYDRLAAPQSRLIGTGFAIHDGRYIATNYHVIPEKITGSKSAKLVVFVGTGKNAQMRNTTLVASDKQHDLAILKISGSQLPPLVLSNSTVGEGELYAFTGFPISGILGLYPATHRGIISSITPIATPVERAEELSIQQLKALRNPYNVYQLDATAYPGNSGSPLYDIETGGVIAVINKVFVKSTREAALSDPSAITYAIPIVHLKKLVKRL